MKVIDFPLESLKVASLSTIIPDADFDVKVGVQASLIDSATIKGSEVVKSPSSFHPAIYQSYQDLFGTEEIEVGLQWIDSQGQTHTNGPQSCAIEATISNGVVEATIGRTGYFVIKAWTEGPHKQLSEGRYSLDCSEEQYRREAFNFMLEHQPKIVGAQTYAICEFGGEKCVAVQLKGPGTGYKQAHSAWVGRGMNPKHLTALDPIRSAQLENITTETGLSADSVDKNLTQPRMLIDEPSTGNWNLVSFLVGNTSEFYIEAFREFTNNQVVGGATIDKLKQAGIGFVPLQGIGFIPLEDHNRYASPKITAYVPYLDVNSQKIVIPDKPEIIAVANRPHTDGFLYKASDPRFLQKLLDIGMGAS